MIDNKTTHRNYPLPDPNNKLKEDVFRLKDSFEQADTDINDLLTTTDNLNTTTAGLTTQINNLSENLSLGSLWQAVSTGNGNTYQVVLNPVPPNLSFGLFVHMKAHVQNTGSATLNVNSLGAQTITKTDGSELKAGDIPANALVTLIYDGTNFQLLNPKSSNEDLENVKSNLFRAFEEIQENHGGSLLMESGWSDSFSNPNEQGADEANSTGFQHDPANKLYKGTDPGIGLNSDIDYDTESNFLQQEWTNSNLGLSQATFTNGSTSVTLNDGGHNWPTNCDRTRIKNNVDGTFYEIVSGQGTNLLTITPSYSGTTDTTADWVILFSQFDSGKVKLQEGGGGYTGDLTSGQTFFASSNASTVGNIFDDNSSTQYYGGSVSQWIGVQFSSAKKNC